MRVGREGGDGGREGGGSLGDPRGHGEGGVGREGGGA